MNTLKLQWARTGFTLDIDLQLPAQGITVLYGPSGSGKTTLLRCVAGLERAHTATIEIDGQVWQDSSASSIDRAGLFLPTWRRPLGYVFQEASLLAHLDVQNNLAFGLKRVKGQAGTRGGEGGHAALQSAIDLLGIGHLLRRSAQELSGGERQRVAIARALVTQPRLLLLDEPLAALDHARKQEILPWLERLRDELKIPMLYVTHAVDEVARLADTLVVLAQGRATAAGPVRQLMARIDTPVMLGDDLATLVDGVVAEHDAPWHLTRVALAGGAQACAIWLRNSGLQIGQKVRLRLLARDISLAVQKPDPAHSSIQNLLPCVVKALVPDQHPSQQLVQLQCGDAVLLARLTGRAVHALNLQVGSPVWAQVKSAALVL